MPVILRLAQTLGMFQNTQGTSEQVGKLLQTWAHHDTEKQCTTVHRRPHPPAGHRATMGHADKRRRNAEAGMDCAASANGPQQQAQRNPTQARKT